MYEATSRFPRDEVYGLRSQIRRSSVSIPTNIAEGCGRGSSDDFARFLHIAMGSASELEYLLFLAGDLGLLETEECDQLSSRVTEIKRMLTSLIQKLKADS